jgi:hypothetical protein
MDDYMYSSRNTGTSQVKKDQIKETKSTTLHLLIFNEIRL